METNHRKWAPWALAAVVLVGILAVVLGCQAPGFSGRAGTLQVVIEDAVSANLLPPVSMACASFDLTVTDADLNPIITENISGNKTFNGLAPGDYAVNLVGLNDTGLAIGSGSGSTTILPGQTSTVAITVTEFDGAGDLVVTADWTAYPGIVGTPVIESELSYGGGTSADISADWLLGTDLATLSKTALARGWWLLAWSLFDNGAAEPSAGFATLARIVKDQITSGTIAIVPNALTGGFQLLITLDFFDPLELSSDVPEGIIILYEGDPDTVIEVAGGEAYQWFLNGKPAGSGDTFTMDPESYGLDYNYRLDCIGYTVADGGKHAGQLSWNIDRQVPLGTLNAIVRVSQVAYQINIALLDLDLNQIGATLGKQTLNPGVDYAFAFPNVPDGQYILSGKMWLDGSTAGSWRYYVGENLLGSTDPAEAVPITANAATEPTYRILLDL